MRQIATAIAVLLMTSHCLAVEDAAVTAAYKALLADYEQEGGPRIFAKRFLEFAEQHPNEPEAVMALLWVVSNVRGKSETTTALDTLAKHHVSSNQLADSCETIASSRSTAAEKLLRAVAEKHPDQQTRAVATYYLAALLETEASLVQQLASQPDLAPRVLQYFGKEYGGYLSSLKPEELAKRREQVFQQMLQSFADVEVQDTKLGQIAEKSLYRMRHLSIGKVAPDIQGQDIHGEEFKLSDYRGKVVMLSFWGHW